MTLGRRVLVVDDDASIRRSLEMLAEAGGLACTTYPDAESLLREAALESAGCVVTDVKMPGLGGLELQRLLRDRAPDLPVVVITGHGDVPMAVRALKAGAVDFIEKPFDGRTFLETVSRALEDRSHALSRRREIAAARRLRDRLSPRQAEVMDLMVEGLSNAQAAARLGVSVRTVENHRAQVLEKMEVSSLPDLVRLAIRLKEA